MADTNVESCSGGSCGKYRRVTSILEWVPTLASGAISLYRIDRDGLSAEMRRSGRACKVWRICLLLPSGRAEASGTQPTLHVGLYIGHHARTSSILIMTTDGVVKAAGFRMMNEVSRWNVEI